MIKIALLSLLVCKYDAFKVNLFTGKSCRQCIKFNRVFKELVEKYPDVNFETIELTGDKFNSDGYEKAKSMKIRVVPTVVFEDEYGTEESRITAVSKNYKDIEQMCKNYSEIISPDNESVETPSFLDKKCEWVVKEMETHGPTVLTNEHLKLCKLCDNIYSDKFLRSTEAHVDNEDTDTQCGMIVSGRKMIVCFRGSDSATDWRLNFYATLSEFPCGTGQHVHSGFLAQWMSIQTEFTSKFLNMMDKHRGDIDEVIFCGHSSGTISCIAAYIMEPLIKETYSKKTTVVTFGAPRMCNELFKAHLEDKVDCTRIVLDRDVITRVPFPLFGYSHIGKPIQIREDCVFERETTTIETLHWMILGLPSADVGIRDHFIYNYTAAIKQWLIEQGIDIEIDPSDILEPIVEQPLTKEPIVEYSDIEEDVVQDPLIQESVVEEDVFEEPVVENDVVQDPIVENEVSQDPIVENEVSQDPIVGENVV